MNNLNPGDFVPSTSSLGICQTIASVCLFPSYSFVAGDYLGEMLRVGLLGATGYMGSSYCSGLVQAFHKGQLSLIILHQPTSETSRYPPDVERRPLDLGGDVTSIKRAIQGLNVVM